MKTPRLYNFLGGLPLVAWYLWGLSREIPLFVEVYRSLNVGGQIGALSALQVFAQVASIAFISLLIVLLVIRDIPRTRIQGFTPYMAAMVGTFAITSSFFLPTARLTTGLLSTAALLIVVGLCLSIYTLVFLGRSFAILPSARALVTRGPYRFVRHPLYVFEEIAIIGTMIQYAQPWSLLIMAVHLVAQLTRAHYEELALSQTFPEYAAYAARTKRFIPGVY